MHVQLRWAWIKIIHDNLGSWPVFGHPLQSWTFCGSSSRCNGLACSVWLCYILIIVTCFFFSQTISSLQKGFRAYPGLKFVVANTLAKWKKLEPNEINLSQGFKPESIVSTDRFVFNSLPARGDFCCLLIIFANSLDPDQARQNVGPDLDPNCLTPQRYWKNPASKE